jgi:hypothetical protein
MIDRRQFLSSVVPVGLRLAAALAACLALVYVWQLSPTDFKPAVRVPVIPLRPDDASAEDAVQAFGEAAYPAIGERPLFYPTRTRWTPPPPPPAPPPVVRAPPPLTGYTLAGVVVSGDSRTALVKAQNGRTTTILTEGQQLDGWTLQKIDETKLLFNAGNSTYEMKLPKPSEIRR